MLYWYKSTKTDAEGLASLRQRITTAGCMERVIHAMNAVNATASTQKWGQEILDRLRWLE
jgi:squalene cyclase